MRKHKQLADLGKAVAVNYVYFRRGQAILNNAKGANKNRWTPGACNTANTPLNIINQMSQILF